MCTHTSVFDISSAFRDLQIRDSGLKLLRQQLRRQRLLRLALDSRHEIASGHRGPVTCAHLDASTQSLLLTGSIDKTVALYDLKPLDKDAAVKVQASKTSAAFLAERAAAAAAVHSAALGPPMGHEYGVSSVQWYPADPGVFISSSFDQRVLLWDTETFRPVTHFELGASVTAARMRAQPDDILIAVAADTSSIVLLDVLSGAATHRLPGHSDYVTCVEWSPTNPYLLASGARNGAVRLFDVRRSGASACLLTLDWMQDHTATQTGVWYRRVDPKGDAIAKAHASSVSSVAFTKNGQTLLTAGAEEQLRAWDVDSGRLHTSEYHGGNDDLMSMACVTFCHGNSWGGAGRGLHFGGAAQISKKPAPMSVVDDLVFLPSSANHAVVAFDIFGR
jgi:DNA excision repair protein ERCC-8